ncbi:MAG TPA: hypothetical protein PKE47_05310, partial [Verrucomicrobiota bacterium]|nr:hypothetical protein [Verrucomicrobiota bacterium]
VLAATAAPAGRGLVQLLDPATGLVMAQREVERPVEDIAVAGPLVYVLTARGPDGALEIFRAEEGTLRWVEGFGLDTLPGAGGRRLRAVVAGDRLYTLNTDGFNFLRRRADGRLEGPPERVLSDQTGWRHFGVTAGGLLVAAADPVPVGGV